MVNESRRTQLAAKMSWMFRECTIESNPDFDVVPEMSGSGGGSCWRESRRDNNQYEVATMGGPGGSWWLYEKRGFMQPRRGRELCLIMTVPRGMLCVAGGK